MSDYIGVVTNIGQAKIAAAIGGTALNLTTIRVGDGNGAPITPTATMTDLVRRVGAAYPIISSGRDPVNANHWRVTALIPVADGPFDIREIGVWDAAGDMIAVAKHVLVEKRSPAQGAAVELLTDIVFPVSETAQVTVQVTPAAQISIFQLLRAGFTVVESATLANPPANPALGRTHVVPAGATGAWVGLAGMIVQWNGTVWVAVDAPIGFHVVDQSKGIDAGSRWLERTAAGWAPGITRLLQKRPGNYAVAGGTATALSVTLDPAPASWNDLIGTDINFLVSLTNTGAATLEVVGIAGTKPITRPGRAVLIKGDLPAGMIFRGMYDGTAVQMAGLSQSVPGTVLVYAVPGTYSWTVPDGVYKVRLKVWGAGGGGGALITSGGSGAGGDGGGYSEGVFSVTPGQVLPIVVGAGGLKGTSAGAGANAQYGGTSSVGSLISATGGGGGGSGYSGFAAFARADPGRGIGGQINVMGQAAANSYQIAGAYVASAGAGAYNTPGTAISMGNSFKGQQPGGGSSGVASIISDGQNGGDGMVIIEF